MGASAVPLKGPRRGEAPEGIEGVIDPDKIPVAPFQENCRDAANEIGGGPRAAYGSFR
jgi:hypothetical protein